MHRWSILLLGSLITAAICGCGGPQQPAEATADTSGDVCPTISPGVCPDGCKWNGKECRRHEGVIMDDARPDAGPQE